ncbi:MAG TPA: hypothetical protein VFJ02_06370 [Vicinamibacterales bacterium]|nr:hypothetical protein [Vicinamibacterales bacterium]
MTRVFSSLAIAAFIGMLAMPALSAARSVQTTAADKDKKDASVAGRWTMNVNGHGGAIMALDLKQDGKAVNGTFETPHDNYKVEGELNGDALTLSTTSSSEVRITLKATLKANGTLDGYLSSQMGDMTWNAERAKAK